MCKIKTQTKPTKPKENDMSTLTKITIAATVAAATIAISTSAIASTDTTVTASVISSITAENFPTSVDFPDVDATTLQSTPQTNVTSNINLYDNDADSTIQVTTTGNHAAEAGLSNITPGQLVITENNAATTGLAEAKMIPISMVCTPCYASGDPQPSAIGFTPYGAAGTAAGGTGDAVVSDASGTRVISITNQYSSVDACTGAGATQMSCTISLGPTAGYAADAGSYTGTISQTFASVI